MFGADRMGAHRRCREEACGDKACCHEADARPQHFSRHRQTPRWFIRAWRRDKCPNPRRTRDQIAGSHAAVVPDVATAVRGASPQAIATLCGNCACTSCAVTAVTDARTYRSTVPQVSRLRQSISMKRTSAARPHELDTRPPKPLTTGKAGRALMTPPPLRRRSAPPESAGSGEIPGMLSSPSLDSACRPESGLRASRSGWE